MLIYIFNYNTRKNVIQIAYRLLFLLIAKLPTFYIQHVFKWEKSRD
jgi:hypothetical protein